MTIPNALAFARNYQIPNTKLSPPLLLHCARQAGIRQMATDIDMSSPLQNENLLNSTSQVNESL